MPRAMLPRSKPRSEYNAEDLKDTALRHHRFQRNFVYAPEPQPFLVVDLPIPMYLHPVSRTHWAFALKVEDRKEHGTQISQTLYVINLREGRILGSCSAPVGRIHGQYLISTDKICVLYSYGDSYVFRLNVRHCTQRFSL